MLKVHLVVGARPNLMKVAPLYKSFVENGDIDAILIDTGQHFDDNMLQNFFNEFGIPPARHQLRIGTASHAVQTAKIMVAYEEICVADRPDWTIVVGDVNSTLACAITSAKLGISLAHLEAGLRSGDKAMPEEINRVITDSVSDLLWTPSQDATENLIREGHASSSIDLVGNIMIDSLEIMRETFTKKEFWRSLGLLERNYCVMTFHRPSNVDILEKLKMIVEQIIDVAKEIKVVIPLHPRTRSALISSGGYEKLSSDENVILCEPLGYVDFMSLVNSTRFVVTDSGGVQEETSYLGIPCFTARDSTERPITLEMGTNVLIDVSEISQSTLYRTSSKTLPQRPPYWDGHTAHRVLQSLLNHAND